MQYSRNKPPAPWALKCNMEPDFGSLLYNVYVKVYLTAVSWRPNIEKIPTEWNFISIFLGNVFLVAQDM